jgi:hypothetical protein
MTPAIIEVVDVSIKNALQPKNYSTYCRYPLTIYRYVFLNKKTRKKFGVKDILEHVGDTKMSHRSAP